MVMCRPADPANRPVDLLVISEFFMSRSIFLIRICRRVTSGHQPSAHITLSLGSNLRPETDLAGGN